jgi:hypothetical protein
MKLNVAIDSGSEDATVLTREVHIATYKGEIEAISRFISLNQTL